MADTLFPSVENARFDDVKGIVTLLGNSLPNVSPSTVWQVPWSWHHYLLCRDGAGRVIAAGSLQPVETGKAEIRGVAVAQDWQGLGIAADIVRSLLKQAQTMELETVCVTRKPDFFRRFGFTAVCHSRIDLRNIQIAAARLYRSDEQLALASRVTMALRGRTA